MKCTAIAILVIGSCFLQVPASAQVGTQEPQNLARSSSEFSPVDIRVPIAPTAVVSADKAYVAYELILTNFGIRNLTMVSVEILSGDSVVDDYRNEKLTNALYRPGRSLDPSDRRDIAPGMSAIVFLWLALDPAAVPSLLHHRLTFRTLDRNANGVDTMVETRQMEVGRGRPIVLTPPFKGGTWAVGNGPSETSIHRRALTLLDGEMHVAQRFAVDWFKLGDKSKGEDDAKLVHDDPRKNENWYGYGTKIVAVADGTVSATKDGIPDNLPLAKSRAAPITPETIAGNYVLLDLGGSHFALFAHLQRGSVRVKTGDRVQRGQTLGLLGDSGNSDSPHLHFHIVDGSIPLGAEGLPFVFESYVMLGVLKDLGVLTRDAGWRSQPGTGIECSRQMPLENMVIRFP